MSRIRAITIALYFHRMKTWSNEQRQTAGRVSTARLQIASIKSVATQKMADFRHAKACLRSKLRMRRKLRTSDTFPPTLTGAIKKVIRFSLVELRAIFRSNWVSEIELG